MFRRASSLLAILLLPATLLAGPGWDPERTLVFAMSSVTWENSDEFDSFSADGRQDDRLVEEFRQAGVPEARIVYLKDREARLSSARVALELLLAKSRPGDMLVFYFQGHGIRKDGTTWFVPYDAGDTVDSSSYWSVPDIFDRIEADFKGSKALLIADCCHAGALGVEAERREGRGKIAYACLGSIPPNEISSVNWTFTACVVAGLDGSYLLDRDADGDIELGEIVQHAHETLAFEELQLAHFVTTNGFDPSTEMARSRGTGTAFVGAQLEAHDGEGWFRAKVTKVGTDGRCYVHYIGYGSQYDEWVSFDRLRPYRPEQYPVGARVECLDKEKWFAGEVLDRRLGLHLVHFDGYDSSWDEWVPAKNMRAEKLVETWNPRKTWVFAVGVLEWQNSSVFASFPKEGRKDQVLIDLLESRGVPGEQITFLTDRQATKRNIETEFRQLLKKTDPGDFLIVYYAGHGVKNAAGVVHFAPYDAESGAGNCWSVPAMVEQVRENFDGQRVLLTADCCFSGSLADAARSQRGQIAFSCLTSSLASVISTGNWTFTECLIDGLGGDSSVDADRDGRVELSELGTYTETRMVAAEKQFATFATTGAFHPQLDLGRVRGSQDAWLGTALEILYEGKWYMAEVIAARKDKLKVTYYGFDSSWDEWVGPDRLRFPRPVSLPADTRVSVLSDGKWYDSIVIDSYQGLHLIHYVGFDKVWDEWVALDRIRR